MARVAKTLSHALYLPRRKEHTAQITRRNNYPFLQFQNLEFLFKVDMASTQNTDETRCKVLSKI
jgi:hypothetical protein